MRCYYHWIAVYVILAISTHTQIYLNESEDLTTKESKILRLLCVHKNKVLRRDLALHTVYGKSDYFLGRSFDVFISKLRKKLEKDPSVRIENVFKVGFRFTL